MNRSYFQIMGVGWNGPVENSHMMMKIQSSNTATRNDVAANGTTRRRWRHGDLERRRCWCFRCCLVLLVMASCCCNCSCWCGKRGTVVTERIATFDIVMMDSGTTVPPPRGLWNTAAYYASAGWRHPAVPLQVYIMYSHHQQQGAFVSSLSLSSSYCCCCCW